jgi:hypothetical protein
MKKLLFTLLFLTILTQGYGQEEKTFDWQQYKKKTQITLGTANLSYMLYMSQKQYFLPVKTQRWLNWCVATPVIGGTLIWAIDYHKKKKALPKEEEIWTGQWKHQVQQ